MNRIALPLLALVAATAAHSAEQSLTVSVTIPQVCVFRGAPAALNFPDIDLSAMSTILTHTEVRYSCTNGIPVQFTVGDKVGATEGEPQTLLRTLTRGANSDLSMGYVLSWVQPSGLGAGHSDARVVRVPIVATLQPWHYQDAAAGEYRDDTLKVSITP